MYTCSVARTRRRTEAAVQAETVQAEAAAAAAAAQAAAALAAAALAAAATAAVVQYGVDMQQWQEDMQSHLVQIKESVAAMLAVAGDAAKRAVAAAALEALYASGAPITPAMPAGMTREE
jgi:hypothetical protein